MSPNADHRTELVQTSDSALRLSHEAHRRLKGDPRVTPVGRPLRRSSRDGRPRRIGVPSGEAGMVDPRPRSQPEMKHMDEIHSASSPHMAVRPVRPGITGRRRVSGRTTSASAQKANLDASHTEGWPPTGDTALAARPVGVALSVHGGH